MTDRPHARLAPSSAHRWGPDGCPGSVAMQEAYPDDPDGEAAREGTAAHWVAEQLLAGHTHSVGTLAPNGYPVTDEMVEGAQMYADDVLPAVHAATGTLRVEQYVDASDSVHPNNGGTPDAYLIDWSARRVLLWDYKFGHKYVDVFRNWQFVDYLACIAESEGIVLDGWSFVVTVVQPRAYVADGPVREWHLSADELHTLTLALREAAHTASLPDAPCRTGPHCYKCSAAHNCEAAIRAGGVAVDVSSAQVSAVMSAAARSLWLTTLEAAVDRLKAQIDAQSEAIAGAIRHGEAVPGYAIGWTKPQERWRAGGEQSAAEMADMFGVDIRKPGVALITPKQAVKLGIDRSVIDAYAETPTGTQKLIRSDKRLASRVFGTRD